MINGSSENRNGRGSPLYFPGGKYERGTKKMIDQAISTEKFLRSFCIAPPGKKEKIIESAFKILNGLPEDSLVYSASQTARLLNCSRQTIWRMQKDNILRPVTIRGLRRFRRADLLRQAGARSAPPAGGLNIGVSKIGWIGRLMLEWEGGFVIQSGFCGLSFPHLGMAGINTYEQKGRFEAAGWSNSCSVQFCVKLPAEPSKAKKAQGFAYSVRRGGLRRLDWRRRVKVGSGNGIMIAKVL